jgi:hypothetical protein
MRADRPHAVCRRPMLNHTRHAHAHAELCRGFKKSLSERHGRGMARERHGMAALCKSNEKDNLNP